METFVRLRTNIVLQIDRRDSGTRAASRIGSRERPEGIPTGGPTLENLCIIRGDNPNHPSLETLKEYWKKR